MIEKPLVRLKQVPEPLSAIIVAAIFGSAAKYFVPSWIVLAIAYLPITIFMEELSRSPSFVSAILSKRNLIASGIILILGVIGAALLFTPVPTNGNSSGSFGVAPNLAYLYGAFSVVGIILGVVLRQSCGCLALAALLGRKRLALNIQTIGIWSVIMIVYPWRDHALSGAWYIFGIAFGIFIHKSSRLSFARLASAYRRIQNIADAWPPCESMTIAEWEALKLLERGRQLPSMKFRVLRRRLEEWRNRGLFTRRLALISASVHRLEGEYERSMNESVSYGKASLEDLEDAHLLLLKAVNLAELGKEDEAEGCLGHIFGSAFGEASPHLFSTRALWSAEKALLDTKNPQITNQPLSDAWRALELGRQVMMKRMEDKENNQKSMDHLLGKFIEFGVPITTQSILDVFGYCHLVAGHSEQAYIMLQWCIEMDPDFSSPYLHLGDYFLFRRMVSEGGSGPSESDLWHADACYRLAHGLEQNYSSRIKRLAEKKINLRKKVVQTD